MKDFEERQIRKELDQVLADSTQLDFAYGTAIQEINHELAIDNLIKMLKKWEENKKYLKL